MSDLSSRRKQPYITPARQNLPDSSREKLKRRKYRARLYNLGRLAGPLKIIGFSLLLASLGYLSVIQLKHLFFATSYFEIKEIELHGNLRLSRAELIKTAGVAPGLNIFSLDRDAVKNRLRSNPVIQDARVELNGLYTLKIDIIERTPYLYAKVGTAFYEISDDGVILNNNGIGELDIPLITGINLEANRPGDSLETNDIFFIAHNWVKTLGNSILANISEINFSSPQNPFVILLSGEKVFPRSLEDFKNRYVFLRALLDNLRKNDVEPIYLDMRAPGEIIVRPRKKTSASDVNRGSKTGG